VTTVTNDLVSMLANLRAERKDPPNLLLTSDEAASVLDAILDNEGRDWRRVKREVRKAILRAKRRNAPMAIGKEGVS